MQILASAGVVGAFALVCGGIYLLGRSLQRRGGDLTFVDPHYPDSMQAVQPKLNFPLPGLSYAHDDTSLSTDDEDQS